MARSDRAGFKPRDLPRRTGRNCKVKTNHTGTLSWRELTRCFLTFGLSMPTV